MTKRQYTIFFVLVAIGICAYYAYPRQSPARGMTGVYWGAFDPPTVAHQEIISIALKELKLKKLIVVVNNHKYKNYRDSLERRLDLMRKVISGTDVELLWQDDEQKVDYAFLRSRIQGPICSIAGYDAYRSWIQHSSPEERKRYDAIAVIPRGDETPLLYDENAFLLPIKEEYRHVSSTKVRAATG
ncbi:MAG: adenylyltransferase/cytidyltransferase family protein [Verrucomicrobia bacterium]|nr:adenylyltransferase/cytidyltransferase family protein [Verrucomicrobiota bacterium]